MRVLKYATYFIALILGCSKNANSSDKIDSLPFGWTMSPNSTRTEYSKVNEEKHSGNFSLHIRREPSEIFGFGSILYSLDAEKYIGKRLRIGIWLKSYDVMKAYFTIRIFSKDSLVAYTTTFERPVTETTDWSYNTSTLDVPEIGNQIVVSIFLHDYGELWVDDLSFEIIEKFCHTDDHFEKVNKQGRLLPKIMATPLKLPVNLGFETN